jgi:5'-3' exonuclease
MTTYILIDTANMFFKSRYVASRMSSDEEKVGMSLHLTLNSVQSVVRRFGGSDDYHVVFCTEGRSWRKDFYKPYKANRAVKRESLTDAEIELDTMFWETYESLIEFLKTKTNTSVLRCATAEADDLIARFIHLHPQDQHYIISTDTDFVQLIAPNVKQFNGVNDQFITLEGYFDGRDSPIKDTKTKEPKLVGDPQWLLFEKCMRGDSSDNVFSAYPGVRTKATKKTIGLIEAYADRHAKGFNWNSMMMNRWTDHNGVEHKVLDDYNRNVTLIDLTAQPQEVKDVIDQSIREGLKTDQTSGVGFAFMKFCAKYELTKISEQATYFAKWLNSPYSGVLLKEKQNVE